MDKELKDYIISMRRHFHMYPEISLDEIKTSEKIKQELTAMGLIPKIFMNNGVMVDIAGKKSGKIILLRADMDALSIQEENNHEYISKNSGVMHACGHDGHMAMLLGAIKYLSKNNDFSGIVRCIFQPAEENGVGAEQLIKEGVLNEVDRVFAIHLWTDIPSGEVYVEKGAQTAAVGYFQIDVEGKGGHGSMPHQCIDSIVVGSNIVNSLQTIISRGINPMETGVITVGEFYSGDRFNIISGKAQLKGTTRTYEKELLTLIPQKMKRVIEGTCNTFEAKVNFTHEWIIKNPCVNDENVIYDIDEILIKENYKKATYSPLPIGEDFSNMLNLVPGALALVGARNKEKNIIYPHHHPNFDIDENSLEIGTKLYIDVAYNFLKV